MGFFGLPKRAPDVPAQEDTEKADRVPNVTADGDKSSHYDSDLSSDNISLEARNEREVQQHPDTVTADAQLGVQKAEAAALVWGKPALLFIYAWYEPVVVSLSATHSNT